MKNICILGSTGSIGVSTLDVLRLNADSYTVIALTANNNIDRLFQQCVKFKPLYAVVSTPELADLLESKLHHSEASQTQVLSGEESLRYVAQLEEVDVVVAAIVGAAGLLPCLSAIEAEKKILLANKEALVISGDLFMSAVKKHKVDLLPLDSEHNAVFQCMPAGYQSGQPAKGIRKILLTASGGPFLDHSLSELSAVTPEQACTHPNWSMGKKISVDSATMMNKGLEVIEASYLFDLPVEQIEVVIHRQSVVHSMVDYIDGSVLAQLGNPDMRTPIAQALAWPERIESGVPALDFFKNNTLTFECADRDRFPCLALAYDALAIKGTAPAILNAANEVAVEAFLKGKMSFTHIPSIIDTVLNQLPITPVDSLDSVWQADQEARSLAHQRIKAL